MSRGRRPAGHILPANRPYDRNKGMQPRFFSASKGLFWTLEVSLTGDLMRIAQRQANSRQNDYYAYEMITV